MNVSAHHEHGRNWREPTASRRQMKKIKNADNDDVGVSKGFGELIYEPTLTHTNARAHTRILISSALLSHEKQRKSVFGLCAALAISIHQSVRPQQYIVSFFSPEFGFSWVTRRHRDVAGVGARDDGDAGD